MTLTAETFNANVCMTASALLQLKVYYVMGSLSAVLCLKSSQSCPQTQQVAAQQTCSVVVKLPCWMLGNLGYASSLYDTTHQQHCLFLPFLCQATNMEPIAYRQHAIIHGLQCSATDKVTDMQTGMPMAALSVLGGQFCLKSQTRAQLYQDFLPWAVRAGFRSADLMCLYYEKHFEVRHASFLLTNELTRGQHVSTVQWQDVYFQDNLEDLRRQWRMEIAPLQARKSRIKL